MRNGVIVKELLGGSIIVLLDVMVIPSTNDEIEDFCQDIIAEYMLRSGLA